jgi:integrase
MASAAIVEYVEEHFNNEAPSTGLVFGTADGEPYSRAYAFGWRRRTSRHGTHTRSIPSRAIGRHIRFHDLRHTFASNLALGRWTTRPCTLLEIQALCRHSSTAMSERYCHLNDGHLQSLTQAVG